MTNRSEIGKGDQCAIYVLGNAERHCDGVIGAHNRTAMCSSIGEDYSTSHWDVVVKAKRGVSKDALLQQIRDLVGALESEELSFYQDVGRVEVLPPLAGGQFLLSVIDAAETSGGIEGQRSLAQLKGAPQ